MPKRNPQLAFFKKEPSAYGGDLQKTRKGRSRGRPLSTRETMHLVLRSTQARGEWSFSRGANPRKIKEIIARFADKNGVKILSLANVGNHLHLHIKLSNRYLYARFIRAVSAAIAMAVTGVSRWTGAAKKCFWDVRPWSRVVQGFKGFLRLRDYITINQMQGGGIGRAESRWIVTGQLPWGRGSWRG